MKSEDIDALVAEKVLGGWRHDWVEGLTVGDILGDYEGCSRCEKGRYTWNNGRRSAHREDEVCVLPFSTDIASAWIVVEHFEALKYDVKVTSCIAGWHCVLGPVGPDIIAFGEKPPLAICLAALKAVGVEVST